jgi:hypothetical protein
MPTDSRPVARLSDPGQLAAVVPFLTGFQPQDSLVVLSLHEPRGRIHLTMRFDLPPEDLEGVFVEEVVARLRVDRAARAAFLVYADGPGLPRRPLVEALLAAVDVAGIGLGEVLHVREGRWWSYTCIRECCPATGSPVPESGEGVSMVAAERALSGRGVLASREDLVRSLAPDAPLGPAPVRSALAAARAELAVERTSVGVASARRDLIARWARAVVAAADPRELPVGRAAARLVVSLEDVRVRDEVLTLVLDRPDELGLLLAALSRQAVPPYDAPVCTVLAWAAYADGHGATAEVALERALRSDPGYGLARLLQQALDGQATPALLRRVLACTRAELCRR